jgi:membrane protein required for colicin V production
MIIDIAALVILLVSAVIAFLRGFIREILTIFGTLGAFAAAYLLGGTLAPLIENMLGVGDTDTIPRLFGILPYDILAKIIAYASIFIVVIVSLSLLSHFIAESVKSMGLGAIDRTFGFIFGLLRGIFIIGLLYLPVHIFVEQEDKNKWFEHSTTHFYIEKTSTLLAHFLPGDTSDAVKNAASDIEDTAEALGKSGDVFDKLKFKPSDEKPSAEVPNQDGYNEDQRDDMDQLFQIEDEPTNNPSRNLNE